MVGDKTDDELMAERGAAVKSAVTLGQYKGLRLDLLAQFDTRAHKAQEMLRATRAAHTLTQAEQVRWNAIVREFNHVIHNEKIGMDYLNAVMDELEKVAKDIRTAIR
jgi:hypothetical protein